MFQYGMNKAKPNKRNHKQRVTCKEDGQKERKKGKCNKFF